MLQGSLKHPLKALLIAAGCGAALALTHASAASAHAGLVSTDPEAEATLQTAPESVSATFSELLDEPSTEIAVTDPDGAVIEVDGPTFDGDTFTQPMRYTSPGEYTVAFRVISEDGHRIDDVLTFTVEEIPAELLVDGAEPTEPAEATENAEKPSPETAETTAAAEEDTNTGAALAAILLAALVIVLGGVVLVKLVGGRSKD